MSRAKGQTAARPAYREGTHLFGAHIGAETFRAVKVGAAKDLIPTLGAVYQSAGWIIASRGEKIPQATRRKLGELGLAIPSGRPPCEP